MYNKEIIDICPYHGECQLSVCKVDNEDYCYIKQLYDERDKAEHEVRRLSIENERLKQKSKYEFDETLLQYNNLIEELKKENAQLKDEIERLKQPSLVVPPTPRMGVSLDEYHEAINRLLSIQYTLAENCKRYTKEIDQQNERIVELERFKCEFYETLPQALEILACLLANEQDTQQAHRISRLINMIKKWQYLNQPSRLT